MSAESRSVVRVTALVRRARVASALVLLAIAAARADGQTVAGGNGHTVILKSDGTVWTVGLNGFGQLGDNSVITRPNPLLVSGLSGIIAVAAGNNHSLALTSGGTVYAWGYGGAGQLGDGSTTTAQKTPVAVPGLSNVVAIAAGIDHSVALRSNGDVYTWGRNSDGQLGNGSTTASSTPVLVASGVAAIAAGAAHTVIVKSDGTVQASGLNDEGQLGDGTNTSRTSFVAMSGVSAATFAAAGRAFTVVRLSDGSLIATGDNDAGQLGDGTTTGRTSPVAVATLTSVAAVAAKYEHVLAIQADGSLWAWGLNGHGALGDGTQTNRSTPTAVPSLTSVARIGVGNGRSYAVTPAGVLYAWGYNFSSSLGDGTDVDRLVPTPITGDDYAWNVSTPQLSVTSGTYTTEKSVVISATTPGATIHYTQNGSEPTEADASVSSGGTVTVATSQTLTAKAFKAGMPSSNADSATYQLLVATPTATPSGGTFAEPLSVTLATTSPGADLRYTTDGTTPTTGSTLYTAPITIGATTTLRVGGFRSGWTNSGILPATYTMNFGTLPPPAMSPAPGTHIGGATVTLSSSQSGATFRYTTNGATVTTSSPSYTAPIVIGTSTTLKARAYHPNYTTSSEASGVYTIAATTPMLSLASGTYAPGTTVTISTPDTASTLRLTLDGTDPTSASPVVASGTTMLIGAFTLKVRAFKANNTDSTVATGTYALSEALGPGAIAAGSSHTVLATPDGVVYAWGLNSSSQLGDGTTTMRLVPTLVPTLTGVTALAAGQAHTLARTADGLVYAWGSNGSGRLGDGTTTPRSRPVLVSSLANVVALAAGDTHSLALTADGRVFAWGANASGQLGLGSTTSQVWPTELTTLSNVVAIAAGATHSLAVTANGAVYAWGANGSSRLGDGTTTMRTSPVLVNVSHVVAIAAGSAHSLALTGNGSVYGWGLGTSGQLGQGSTASFTTPIVIPGLQASAIAAGSNHSAAIRRDGALVVWGANGSGQIGDGSTTLRTQPTAVAGLASISSLTLGGLHSAVVTSDGDGWAWGEAGSGQVGDNGTTDRTTPVSVVADLPRWTPAAPTLDLASGTLAAPQIVTIGSPIAGATVRYTLSGAEPTEADPALPASGELAIDFSTMLRARAFVTGRVPGRVARADYVLQSAAPTITPGTGTYASAQTVTLAASGPPTTIRYTLNGSDPTDTSALYTSPFVVTTALVVKARAYPTNGWTPSAVTTATLTFNYGVLNPPVASPGGGVYLSTQTVTLSALVGATIRYTTDGSDPSAVSNLYSGPLSLPGGVTTVKAKAFHPDWTASATMTETVTLDGTAPTIRAATFPYAVGGWYSAPVTVSFTCIDAIGIASCSTPVTVSQDGTTVVSGTATDVAGNQTSANVTINLDTTPPEVALTSPTADVTTTAATIELTGTVSDVGSGVSVASCNGVPVTPVSGQVTCTVPLRPGRNTVVLVARDAAGHNVSAGVRVTRTGTPTTLTLAPGTRTLLVGEAATLSVSDDYGLNVAGASWVASDPNVVSLSTDDPPVLTALAAGSATITATKNGLSSTATLTVVGGTSLPDGTTRWSVAPTPGLEMTSPLYTHVVDETVPDLFTVENNATGDEFTMRALSATGEQKWVEAAPGVPVMGDSFGGVVAQTLDEEATPIGLARFAGPADAPPWRYDAARAIGRPAQGPDGTIYVVESHPGLDNHGLPIDDLSLAVLDGETGRLRARVPLPRDFVEFYAAWEGQFVENVGTCHSDRWESPPQGTTPVVGADGFGYLQVRRTTRVDHGYCVDTDIYSRADDHTLQLLKVSPQGVATWTTLYAFTGPSGGSNPWFPETGQTVPDGLGGVLVTWKRVRPPIQLGQPAEEEWTVTRFDVDSVRSDFPIPDDTYIAMTGDVGTAYLWTGGQNINAVDVTSMSTKWTAGVAGVPVMATPFGGVALYDTLTQSLTVVNEIGETGAPSSLPSGSSPASPLDYGVWYRTAVDQVAASVGPVLDESPFSFSAYFGNYSSQLATQSNCSEPKAHPNFKGWQPGSTVLYEIANPSGWTQEQLSAIDEAFTLWTAANLASGLNTVFAPASGGQSTFTFWKGQIAPNNWAEGTITRTQPKPGIVVSEDVTATSDTTKLSSGTGFLRMALHEIGHSMGLDDSWGRRASSVMNQFSKRSDGSQLTGGWRDDPLGQISLVVTPCDSRAAVKSSQR